MKKQIDFLFLFLVSVFIVHSCTDEFYDETENSETLEARKLLSEAKAWYEGVSESGVSVLYLASGDTEFPVKPDWKRYSMYRDTTYEAVEIELRTRYSLTIADGKAGEKYRNTGDNRYRSSSLNLVFRKDLKTGEVSGFYMNILPDAEYLESINFDYAKRMNCLKPDTIFCGRIVYYDAEGKFMDGWRYRQGKIVASLNPIPKEIGEYLMEHPTTSRGGEYGSDDCSVYTTWKIYDVYNEWSVSWDIYTDFHLEYLYTEIEYDIWYECETEIEYGDDGGAAGGGTPPNNGNNGIFVKTSLDSEGKELLNRVLEEKLQECGYSTMYNYLTENNYKLNDVRINPSLFVGGYNYNTKEIEFSSNDAINNAFPEEFIHFFQDMYYPEGIGQYGKEKAGHTNIEFEAKLLQDLMCRITDGACPQYGAVDGSKLSDDYVDWILDMTEGGTIPSYEMLIEPHGEKGLNYWDFIENLTDGKSEYSSPIDKSLQPLVIQYIHENGCY
jgi:hypothetical protein